MNLGLGVERLAMILHQENDIREMVYPHIYGKWHLSDRGYLDHAFYQLLSCHRRR